MTRNSLNRATILKLFPQASEEFILANLPQSEPRGALAGVVEPARAKSHEQDNRAKGSRKTAKLERPSGNGTLGTNQGQEAGSGRLHIRFESVRKRLLDPDNIAEKWLLDALRFSGVLQGDEPDKITLETTQRKCEKGEEEHTLIQIFEPSIVHQ